MHTLVETAYAKINLFLDVLDRRDDGFHTIRSVMHSVSLADEITVTVAPSDTPRVILSVSGDDMLATDEGNLVFRAASLYLERSGISAELRVTLEKHIPIGAGLGGGSTDAAATLRVLNRAFCAFSNNELLILAAELGSDVPYCLIGGTALCFGRGERMERLPENLKLHLVVAVADEHVSTPAAYSELDSIFGDFKLPRDGDNERPFDLIMESVSTGKLADEKLYNIFEKAVFKTCFGAESIKARMIELGATHALMSGSGPSVFGIFASEREAIEAKEAFVKSGIRAYYAATV